MITTRLMAGGRHTLALDCKIHPLQLRPPFNGQQWKQERLADLKELRYAHVRPDVGCGGLSSGMQGPLLLRLKQALVHRCGHGLPPDDANRTGQQRDDALQLALLFSVQFGLHTTGSL